MATISFGYGKQAATLTLDKLNRHGIIAGATGTGKTITLKVIAEQLSLAGIPVFMSDIKGDLASLAEANPDTQSIAERLRDTHDETYEAQAFPVELWDVFGENGTPLRVTISEMGPVMLTRLLGLNEVQESILNIVFDVADKQGLLLIDLMDLRAMLNYVGEHADELSQHYGNITKQSVGAILRSLVTLEKQGADRFFTEPSLDIMDFMRTDHTGKGYINILAAEQLLSQPTLYATVLLAILAEMYETLPEVGDLDKPKLVFFFDEAHTLFRDVPKVLLEKIELVVRLVRSKGIGVFFITQNPTDIPDTVASQLGNRIQHGLRAFTPKEIKTVTAVAETFRQEPGQDLASVIQALEVGQAVVSTLQADGTPAYADTVMIYPPQSKLGVIDPSVKSSLINQSSFSDKYGQSVNRESAHEQILKQTQAVEAELTTEAKATPAWLPTEDNNSKPAANKARTSNRRSDSAMDRFTKNVMSAVGREVGRMITRGVTGMFKK